MAITLLNSAGAYSEAYKQGMVEIFATSNPIVQYVPVNTIEKQQFIYSYLRETAVGTTAVRDINDTYTASNAEYEKQLTQLKVIGGKYTVDRLLDSENEKTRQAIAKAKSTAATVQKMFFKGLASDNEFNGLEYITTQTEQAEVPGTIAVNPNGLDVLVSAANSKTFIYSITDMINEVDEGPELAFLMSRRMAGVVNKAILNMDSNIVLTSKDTVFGTVPVIDGIPILYITRDVDNADVLGFDETVGGSSDCGSIYLVDLNELSGCSFISWGENSIADIGVSEIVNAGESHSYLFELVLGLAVKKVKAAYRLYGIRV